MIPRVLDISHHNTIDSFERIFAAGIEGIIHKATQGSGYIDPTYNRRKQDALNAGLLWGAYHFADSSSVDVQIENFLDVVKPGDQTLMALDYEPLDGKTMTIDQTRDFLTQIQERIGRKAVLYSGNLIKETLKQPDPFFNEHRLWLAQYGPSFKLPVGWDKYWLWQYSENGSIDGGGGKIDLNAYEGSAEQLVTEWAS